MLLSYLQNCVYVKSQFTNDLCYIFLKYDFINAWSEFLKWIIQQRLVLFLYYIYLYNADKNANNIKTEIVQI